jgi:hypothetical protein
MRLQIGVFALLLFRADNRAISRDLASADSDSMVKIPSLFDAININLIVPVFIVFALVSV